MKMPIVFEFLLSRTIETDTIRAFSKDQKADGTKSSIHIYMPHHIGGDNATKVRRRSTCRNSFRDIFLHDPCAHHPKHAYEFQVLLKNTPKNSLVSKLYTTLLASSRMPYHKQSGKQIPLTCLLTDFLFQCLLDSLCTVTFLCLPKTVSMIPFSISFENNNLLQGIDRSSRWNQSL